MAENLLVRPVRVIRPKTLARYLTMHKADPVSGCWLWTGWKSPEGYGRASFKWAHRLYFENIVGPIPSGMQLDHLCRTRSCVNPQHLEIVTAKINILRSTAPTAVNAAKTHCKRGHSLELGAYYVTESGGRRCKLCRLATVRAKKGLK